jgi:ATP-dependent Lon protease
MEILRLPGYITEEKLEIAKRFIIPRQIIENGLRKQDIDISDDAVIQIISAYTWESGVRNLEREIANVCRKVARKIAEGSKTKFPVNESNLHDYLGAQKVFPETAHRSDEIGIATGLAWTQNGGEILFIESRMMPGNRGLQLTGQLGNVMKESAQAALSYIRSRAKELNISRSFFDNMDIHIHIPSGSTPKDGPSAGITIAICLASLLTRQPVRSDIAMTGEITLRGKVMPVGGIREKVVAARRAGIKTIIMPRLNQNDLETVPDYIKQSLKFHFVDHIDDVLPIALIQKNHAKNGQPKINKSSPKNRKPATHTALKKNHRRIQPITQKTTD